MIFSIGCDNLLEPHLVLVLRPLLLVLRQVTGFRDVAHAGGAPACPPADSGCPVWPAWWSPTSHLYALWFQPCGVITIVLLLSRREIFWYHKIWIHAHPGAGFQLSNSLVVQR
jgi:hypothetical protein